MMLILKVQNQAKPNNSIFSYIAIYGPLLCKYKRRIKNPKSGLCYSSRGARAPEWLWEEHMETSGNVLLHKFGKSFEEFVVLCFIHNLHVYYVYSLGIQIFC